MTANRPLIIVGGGSVAIGIVIDRPVRIDQYFVYDNPSTKRISHLGALKPLYHEVTVNA